MRFLSASSRKYDASVAGGRESIAPIFYDIDSPYVGDELDSFTKRVNEVFEWYTKKRYEQYMAPYFPIIQSSGCGKTKLLYEYWRQKPALSFLNPPVKPFVKFCRVRRQRDEGLDECKPDAFECFDFTLSEYKGDNDAGFRDNIRKGLDQFLECNETYLVLLFDESHPLKMGVMRFV